MNRQTGIALITTLWVVALLMIMALSYRSTIHAESRLIRQSLDKAQSQQLAESGIWLAVQNLLKARPEGQSKTQFWQLGEGEAQVTVTDQNGLIDLNYAPPAMIKALLKAIGWPEIKAQSVASQIKDWRDTDHDKQAGGAEDMDYKAAGKGYESKDAAFNTVEELRLLASVTEQDYQQVSAFFTVYSQQRSINLDLAPAALLSALGPDVASFDSPGLSSDWQAAWFNQRPGRAFEISSKANFNGNKSQIRAVVLLNPTQQQDFAILSWQLDTDRRSL